MMSLLRGEEIAPRLALLPLLANLSRPDPSTGHAAVAPHRPVRLRRRRHSALNKPPHGPWGVTYRRSLLGSHKASQAPFKSQKSAPPLRKARPKVRSATAPCLSRPQLTTHTSPRHPVPEVTDHDVFSVDVDDVPAGALPSCSVPVWVDPDGLRFDFCCKDALQAGQRGRRGHTQKSTQVLRSFIAAEKLELLGPATASSATNRKTAEFHFRAFHKACELTYFQSVKASKTAPR
jgi:hypothetical protein